MKKNVKDFIKEIVPIIAGILIALFINNYKEDREDEKYIDRIFSFIDKELVESNEEIIYAISTHETLVDTLNYYANDSTESVFQILRKVDGIRMPNIRINSWKAISNSRIELVDYHKLSALSDIEASGKNLDRLAEKLIDFSNLNARETGRNKKEMMKMMIRTIIGNESYLQKDIEKFLNE